MSLSLQVVVGSASVVGGLPIGAVPRCGSDAHVREAGLSHRKNGMPPGTRNSKPRMPYRFQQPIQCSRQAREQE